MRTQFHNRTPTRPKAVMVQRQGETKLSLDDDLLLDFA